MLPLSGYSCLTLARSDADRPGRNPASQVSKLAVLALKGGVPELVDEARPGGMKFSPSWVLNMAPGFDRNVCVSPLREQEYDNRGKER